MLITIQRGIAGLPYSVNKQEFDTAGMSHKDVIDSIAQAKILSDMVEEAYGNISPLDIQLAEDNKKYKELLNMLTIQSEQKSVFIRFLKDVMKEEDFNKIREACVASTDYQKITAHSNDKPE